MSALRRPLVLALAAAVACAGLCGASTNATAGTFSLTAATEEPPARESAESAPGSDPKAKKKKGPKPPDPGLPKSARLPNPWYLSMQVWARSYVAISGVDGGPLGPLVSGVSPSLRMGPGWRFDLGIAWSHTVPHVILYPGFRQFWFPFMWISLGFVIPLADANPAVDGTQVAFGIYGGPGCRWMITPDFGVFLELTPIVNPFQQIFVLEGQIGFELGIL